MNRLFFILFGLFLSAQSLAVDLTVSAAASLTHVFRELAPVFEAQNRGTKVLLNFGASGSLLQQIAKGAPVDVFASADQETMNQAQVQGLIQSGERHNFASNKLAVVVPAVSLNSHPIPRALSDLMQSHYQRIAMGVPESVPAGRYAKNVLERSGHWRGIEKKVIRAQTVRQALDYVARAEVEAGFVYVTDAAMMPNQVKVAFVVPTEVPILYPIASVSGGMNHAMALKFIEFVQSPLAQGVLAQYGFGKP